MFERIKSWKGYPVFPNKHNEQYSDYVYIYFFFPILFYIYIQLLSNMFSVVLWK